MLYYIKRLTDNSVVCVEALEIDVSDNVVLQVYAPVQFQSSETAVKMLCER